MKKSYFVALILFCLSVNMLLSETRHLIIAPEEFMEAGIELSDYYAENYGIERELLGIEDIISGADDAAEALRNYLESYFTEPGVATEGSSVLLLGSGTRDWSSGSIRNRIPVYENYGIMSDSWLVDFDGDRKAELAIGRIPASTENELSGYMNRYMAYLDNESSGLWQRRLLFCADDEMGLGGLEGITPGSSMNHSARSDDLMNIIEDYYLKRQVYGIDYEADNDGYKPAARNDIIEILNEGVNLWCYTGHSSASVFGDEYYFTEEDIADLANNGRRGFMFVAGCKTGDFGNEVPCISEQLLFDDSGGIIGSFTSTEYTNPHSNNQMGLVLLSALYNDNSNWGEAMLAAQYNSTASVSNTAKYNILGDPLAKLSNGITSDLITGEEIENMLPGEELYFTWQCAADCTEALTAIIDASSYIEYSHTLDENTYEYNRWRPGKVVISQLSTVSGGWVIVEIEIPEDVVEGNNGRIFCLSENGEGETLSWFSGDIQLGDNNEAEPDIVPVSAIQLNNYPNPFNPETTIRYYLPGNDIARLAVYNIKGKLVKNLINNFENEGWHEMVWDGKNIAGKQTASGIYLINLQSGQYSISRKISLLK